MSPRDIRKFKKATAGALLNVRTIHTEQMSPGRRRLTRTSTVARLNALVWPSALPAPGFAVTVAAGFLIVETVLVVLLKQVEPEDPVGIVYAVLMGVALVGNFVAGVAAAASASADRRREAELSSELAHMVLRTGDLQSAANEVGRHLAAAFNLRFASVELTEAAGDHRPGAIPLHEDDVLLGVLEVPDDLPRTTRQRLLRVVPTLEALLAAARDREKVNNRLIESRHRLEQFFDLTSDLMVISDQDKLLQVNPAFEKRFGLHGGRLGARPIRIGAAGRHGSAPRADQRSHRWPWTDSFRKSGHHPRWFFAMDRMERRAAPRIVLCRRPRCHRATRRRRAAPRNPDHARGQPRHAA